MEHAADERFPGTTVAAAVLATLFFPLLSLIAALFLMGRERSLARRAQMRTWAWASAGWIVAQFLVFLFFAVALFVGGGSVESDPVRGPTITVAP